MDSLKLDAFKRLLHRQYSSISTCDTNASSNSTNSTSAVNRPSATPSAIVTRSTIATSTLSSPIATITTNLPNYITKDNPKPAIFIARKLFCDYFELVDRKADNILSQEQTKDKSIFEWLQRDEDVVYDRILQGLGSISEYCLPSLLKLLLEWYHYQLDADESLSTPTATNPFSSATKRPPSSLDQIQSSHIPQNNQQHNPDQSDSENHPDNQEICASPCNNEPGGLPLNTTTNDNPTSISTLRSPTPSSPDTTSNQISLNSSLPLDYQSPISFTIQRNSSNNNDGHQSSNSTANTSTSTATNPSSNNSIILDDNPTTNIKRLELIRIRRLYIEYNFCQALIEIFSKLYLHPGHDDLIGQIEDIAFQHFKLQESNDNIDSIDTSKLVDKYAEVIGVLVQTRFRSIKKRFFAELVELRNREPTPSNIQSIILLLSSMKYFRVKMAPIEEFEASFQFLQECADYFIELRHKSIKHKLAELFVEIMSPLASTVKNEVKIPCLKNFVETLWSQTLEMCARKKHSITLFPLVTCLLCVSQRTTFLQNWGTFLNMCLSNLKNRDQKMCQTALESLYKLLWVYMIRIRCESNNITQTRLQSIVDTLFPRGSRQVVPRDMPSNIFVDMIQFIAQERLDFAIRHVIFELLSVDRPIKMIVAPERMNIGLQAFLVIAESLQQKEGDLTMPTTIDMTPSSSKLSISNTSTYQNCENSTCLMRRAHHHHNHKMLNDEAAKSIGLHPYYNHIQRSFNEILKNLDVQFGRPLLLTSSQNNNREPDDMITGDRKLKVDLFKTCIAAIPRLMPDGMSKSELIELLSRMTVHVDEEMRRYAFESLQILVIDFPEWRLDAIEGFTLFLANQIDESMRTLVDKALKMLLQLLISWHNIITPASLASDSTRNNSVVNIQTGHETISSRGGGTGGGQIAARKNRALAEMRLIQSELSNVRFDRLVSVIQKVEGASLVMLCSCHQPFRRLASLLLRECRAILKSYSSWTCMEQFGFRSPDDAEEEDLSASLKGSMSADNLSRITATSGATLNCGPIHSSATSMNTQTMLSTSVSKMCISSSGGGFNHQVHQHSSSNNNNNQQHDLYDEDIENNLLDGYSNDDNSTLIFWIAVMMLESNKEQEYIFGLRLLKKILPNLPFEQQDFLDELEKNLRHLEWNSFTGIHALVLKGCASSATYDLCIALLDHLTPLLKHKICIALTKVEDCLPFHILILSTHLLSTYEDPTPFSMNIARRLALCCEENSQKLECLAAVMNLYSRRSFSKDSFQWIKCVAKYLHDANPQVLPNVIPLLVDLLELGPPHIQRLVPPVLYCMLSYIDINLQPSVCFNADLTRLYKVCLGSPQLWRDAQQLFKLIISKSSSLPNSNSSSNGIGGYTCELPGRVMDFSLDIESLPVIGKARLAEFILVNANSMKQQSSC